MFGNLTGWVISMFIAAAGVVVGYQLLLIAQPTPSTGWAEKNIQPLTAADTAKTVLDPMNNLKDDAGDLYRAAIDDLHHHPDKYKALQDTKVFDEPQVTELAGMDDLLKAAGCPAMNLLESKPDSVVGFDSTVPELEDLEEIAKATSNVIALAMYEKNYAFAHKYANALAALGYHLYQERLAYIELSTGDNFLGTGIGGMIAVAKMEKQDKAVSDLETFDKTREDEYTRKIEPAMEVLANQGEANIGEHAGDMFELASGSQFERVWRVEGIRKVGRLQFNAVKGADQIKAPKFLSNLASDMSQDPIIRLAATKARDMTSRDNQSQR